MSKPAQVSSIEAVHVFRGSLREFDEQLRSILVNLDLELRRAMDWIESDRPTYWKQQSEQASQQVIDARTNLERCELTTVANERRSCSSEKKALEKAKRRMQVVEQKREAAKHWLLVLRHEGAELTAQLAKLAHLLDDDVARGLASLARMTAALDTYAGQSGPKSAALDNTTRGAVVSHSAANTPAPRPSPAAGEAAGEHQP